MKFTHLRLQTSCDLLLRACVLKIDRVDVQETKGTAYDGTELAMSLVMG